MKIYIKLLIVFFCSLSYAGEDEFSIVDQSVFKKGSYWVWSYAEKNKEAEGGFSPPYLFEKYEVVEVENGKVTIEMFSSPDLLFDEPSHHRFIADVKKCLEVGGLASEKRMKHWRIEFYTKSIDSKWSLVSRKFKNLAFTEKFNCYSSLETGASKTFYYEGADYSINQTTQESVKTWFIKSEDELKGVGALRLPNGFRVELVKFN